MSWKQTIDLYPFYILQNHLYWVMHDSTIFQHNKLVHTSCNKGALMQKTNFVNNFHRDCWKIYVFCYCCHNFKCYNVCFKNVNATNKTFDVFFFKTSFLLNYWDWDFKSDRIRKCFTNHFYIYLISYPTIQVVTLISYFTLQESIIFVYQIKRHHKINLHNYRIFMFFCLRNDIFLAIEIFRIIMISKS